MICTLCKNTLIDKDETAICRLKFCHQCKTDIAVCFCDKICNNVVKSSNEGLQCEYLSCGTCSYLAVRCVACRKLCEIQFSSENCGKYPSSLYWKCMKCNSFRGLVKHSISRHVDAFKDNDINVEAICSFIVRQVSTFACIHLLCSLISARQYTFEEVRSCLTKKYPDDENVRHIIQECEQLIVQKSSPAPENIKIAQLPIIDDGLPVIIESDSFNRFFNDDGDDERISQLEKKFDEFYKEISQKFESLHESITALTEYKKISVENIGSLQNDLKTQKEDLNSFKSIMNVNLENFRNSIEEKVNKLVGKFEEVKETLTKTDERLETSLVKLFQDFKITNEV